MVCLAILAYLHVGYFMCTRVDWKPEHKIGVNTEIGSLTCSMTLKSSWDIFR